MKSVKWVQTLLWTVFVYFILLPFKRAGIHSSHHLWVNSKSVRTLKFHKAVYLECQFSTLISKFKAVSIYPSILLLCISGSGLLWSDSIMICFWPVTFSWNQVITESNFCSPVVPITMPFISITSQSSTFLSIIPSLFELVSFPSESTVSSLVVAALCCTKESTEINKIKKTLLCWFLSNLMDIEEAV